MEVVDRRILLAAEAKTQRKLGRDYYSGDYVVVRLLVFGLIFFIPMTFLQLPLGLFALSFLTAVPVAYVLNWRKEKLNAEWSRVYSDYLDELKVAQFTRDDF